MPVPDRTDDLNRYFDQRDETEQEDYYTVAIPIKSYVEVQTTGHNRSEARANAIDEGRWKISQKTNRKHVIDTEIDWDRSVEVEK